MIEPSTAWRLVLLRRSAGKFGKRSWREISSTDLALQFRTQQTGLACGATSALLTGKAVGGQPIQGSDAVRMVPCRVS